VYVVFYSQGIYLTASKVEGKPEQAQLDRLTGGSWYLSNQPTFQQAMGEAIATGFKHGDKTILGKEQQSNG
jgi:hypothetical protein